MSLEKNTTKGDSLTEYPTYIKHWEEAKPWGWEIKILTENGLHTSLIASGRRIERAQFTHVPEKGVHNEIHKK